MLEKHGDDVNLVIKHFPLRKRKYAKKASIVALAADKQGKYQELTRIFYQKKKLNDEVINKSITELGLDIEMLERDITDPALQQIIIQDMNVAIRIGVRGVPALYINGKLVRNRSLNAMSQMIKNELKRD